MKRTVLLVSCLIFSTVAMLGIVGCASTTSTANVRVKQGMPATQVTGLLGNPDNREFRDDFEAWQYADVVGFGQCEYVTIFFANGVVRSMTSVRGGSIAGCGLGSDPVDWNQMAGSPTTGSGAKDRQPSDSSKPIETSPAAERDKYADLERLKKLLDDGALTQEEYDIEKAKILNR